LGFNSGCGKGCGLFKKSLWLILLTLILSLFLIPACAGKDGSIVTEKGDKVKVDYTGTLNDGTVFDSSKGRTPLEFTVGAGQMIAGFDKAVLGMQVGQTKKVTIPAAEAYGTADPEMVVSVPKSKLPSGMNPKIGDRLVMASSDGQQIPVRVVEVNANDIKVDANHELAGQDLTFEITMVAITK
jgi:peptidylprolyl isomerase